MEYRTLGKTHLQVSVIGLGTEHLVQERETVDQFIQTAVEAGVNYIDILYSDPQADAAFWNAIAPALNAHRERCPFDVEIIAQLEKAVEHFEM